MTQEDKELLLKDLCARLPYGVKVESVFINPDSKEHKSCGIEVFDATSILMINDGLGEFKSYLFPLSSMTEAQQEEFDRIYADDMQVVANNLKNRLDGKPYETNLGHYRHIDWLNKNHFDYRGLIEKGLAIDATGLNIY